MNAYLAIDIGASSGRHILGWLEDGRLKLEEIYRFDNTQLRLNGHDCWDLDALYRHILQGMKACKTRGILPSSVGIDTWGVDFVLLDESDRIVGNAESKQWDMEVIRRMGLPERIFRPITMPGTVLDSLAPEVQTFVGYNRPYSAS